MYVCSMFYIQATPAAGVYLALSATLKQSQHAAQTLGRSTSSPPQDQLSPVEEEK